jgi:hypothetical protein
VSNSSDPKREHDYEIVLNAPEVASFSPENKHTRAWRLAPEKGLSGKGKRFQDGKGMKAGRQV